MLWLPRLTALAALRLMLSNPMCGGLSDATCSLRAGKTCWNGCSTHRHERRTCTRGMRTDTQSSSRGTMQTCMVVGQRSRDACCDDASRVLNQRCVAAVRIHRHGRPTHALLATTPGTGTRSRATHSTGRVRLQGCQSGHGAPLLGQRPAQAVVVHKPASGRGTRIRRSDACPAQHGPS
jgi:hypothetical protein